MSEKWKPSLIHRIKYWFSEMKYAREHNKQYRALKSIMEKSRYKSRSTDIIKILNELDKKAGLGSYDIVPFLKKIKLMSYRNIFIDSNNVGYVTDRHLNDELFKELEQLKFIRIIENKLFSDHQGVKFKTPAEQCVLKVKLLPKGIDYLVEYKKRKKDYKFAVVTIVLLLITAIFSIPQACNNWEQYQLLKDYKKDTKISKCESDIKKNNSVTSEKKNKLENGEKTELVIKPILDTIKH